MALTGFGFTYDGNSFPSGGTITNVNHFSAGSVTLATITGVSVGFVDAANALTFNQLSLLVDWIDVMPEDVEPSSPPTTTQFIFANSDGIFTRVQGTGFTFDAGTGEVLTGTATSIDQLNAALSQIDTSGVINESLESILNYFESPVEMFGALILSGNDTFNVLDSDGVFIPGLDGDDIIIGGTGDDEFEGGKGNDTLTGNGGADVFSYDEGDPNLANDGDDTITDFTVGVDKIKIIDSTTINQFNDLNIADNMSGDAVITLDNGTITLTGVATAQLSASDFGIFGGSNDPFPEIFLSGATATEGDDLVFTVSLSTVTAHDVMVQVQTIGGGTASGADFNEIPSAANQILTITAGNTNATFTVSTTQDLEVEGNETVRVMINFPVGGGFAGGAGDLRADGLIEDDEMVIPATNR